VLFSLISPTARLHLQLVSRLSYALHDTGFRRVLARQATGDDILNELRRIEAGLTAAARRKAAP
jgi:PTS system nitrogen regulatory IIA component